MSYISDPTPGEWDHRGGDCVKHGANVVHARAKGALGQFFCVQCMLDHLKRQAVKDLYAAEAENRPIFTRQEVEVDLTTGED